MCFSVPEAFLKQQTVPEALPYALESLLNDIFVAHEISVVLNEQLELGRLLNHLNPQ